MSVVSFKIVETCDNQAYSLPATVNITAEPGTSLLQGIHALQQGNYTGDGVGPLDLIKSSCGISVDCSVNRRVLSTSEMANINWGALTGSEVRLALRNPAGRITLCVQGGL
jgi:hypothetical protein